MPTDHSTPKQGTVCFLGEEKPSKDALNHRRTPQAFYKGKHQNSVAQHVNACLQPQYSKGRRVVSGLRSALLSGTVSKKQRKETGKQIRSESYPNTAALGKDVNAAGSIFMT